MKTYMGFKNAVRGVRKSNFEINRMILLLIYDNYRGSM